MNDDLPVRGAGRRARTAGWSAATRSAACRRPSMRRLAYFGLDTRLDRRARRGDDMNSVPRCMVLAGMGLLTWVGFAFSGLLVARAGRNSSASASGPARCAAPYARVPRAVDAASIADPSGRRAAPLGDRPRGRLFGFDPARAGAISAALVARAARRPGRRARRRSRWRRSLVGPFGPVLMLAAWRWVVRQPLHVRLVRDPAAADAAARSSPTRWR